MPMTMPPRTPTMPTTPGSTRRTRPKPKQRLIRKSAGGVQKFRINKLEASDHAKCALKRATKWYAKEKNKTGGLSSLQIDAVADDIIGALGMENKTIEGTIDEGAV